MKLTITIAKRGGRGHSRLGRGCHLKSALRQMGIFQVEMGKEHLLGQRNYNSKGAGDRKCMDI